MLWTVRLTCGRSPKVRTFTRKGRKKETVIKHARKHYEQYGRVEIIGAAPATF